MEKQVNLLPAQADETVKLEKIEEIETAAKTAQNKTVTIAQQMSAEEFLEVEKRLKRKLDTRLMAPIVFIYILNYLDRCGLSAPMHACHLLTAVKEQYRGGQNRRPRDKPRDVRYAILDCCVYPLCRICPGASTRPTKRWIG